MARASAAVPSSRREKKNSGCSPSPRTQSVSTTTSIRLTTSSRPKSNSAIGLAPPKELKSVSKYLQATLGEKEKEKSKCLLRGRIRSLGQHTSCSRRSTRKSQISNHK